jgi:hypothetical protein
MPCIACRAVDEWLGTHIFHSIQEVQDYATKWLWTYNNPSHGLQANHCRATDRPNMGIGGITLGFARSGRKRSTGLFLYRPHPAMKLNQYQMAA